MQELRAENERLRRINEEEDRQLQIEMQSSEESKCFKLRRRRDEGNNDPENEDPSN